MFPQSGHSYLGLIYHHNQTDERTDFGSIYIKGNGSYVRVNPRRDHNANRPLYEEFRTPLSGKSAIEIGKWQHLKVEVMDSVCHFYVGDMITPKVTFDALEFKSGRVGFKPRVTGAPVWLDNVRITSISRFGYTGFAQPDGIEYEPETLITDWQVIGPFSGPMLEIEQVGFVPKTRYKQAGRTYSWRSFDTDRRGCVVSGRVTQFLGPRGVAYFYTTLTSHQVQKVELRTSTTEKLAVWLNDDFIFYNSPRSFAWYDFWKNPDHRGFAGQFSVAAGRNSLLIRVRVCSAGGGFFVYAKGLESALARN